MHKLAYLDSARMGLMCERARLAHIDYIKLAGLEGCSLYFEQLLESGFGPWPTTLQRQFSGLADWRGPAELKSALRSLVSLPSTTPVLLANRSAQLMRLAARALAEKSRRILLTDLTWPGYRRILERERQAGNLGVTTVPLRDEILFQNASLSDVLEVIAERHSQMQCDAVFLPAVSHLGIRLPVDRILETLNRIHRPHFVVVDGAQALGHVPDQLGLEHCDIFIAGCHKWLEGHVPMGVGFCPSHQSCGSIESTCHRMALAGELDDPLLHFVQQLEGDSPAAFGETVSLSALFATRAALASGISSPGEIAVTLDVRRRNAERLAKAARGAGWNPVLPQQEFRSGILLLQREASLDCSPRQLRALCLAHGLAVTAYDGGLIRLAMPSRLSSDAEFDSICHALRKCASTSEPDHFPTGPASQHAAERFVQPFTSKQRLNLRRESRRAQGDRWTCRTRRFTCQRQTKPQDGIGILTPYY